MVAGTALACILVMAACGGDDAADAPTVAADAAEEPAPNGASGDASVGAGTAEVTVEGVTHRYARVEGATTFCTSIGGSLQAGLPEIDDAGAPIPDAELTVYLLEADADPELHSPPSIEVELADGTKYAAGDIGGLETPPVELEPDGRAASGTVQLVKDFDPDTIVGADIEIDC